VEEIGTTSTMAALASPAVIAIGVKQTPTELVIAKNTYQDDGTKNTPDVGFIFNNICSFEGTALITTTPTEDSV